MELIRKAANPWGQEVILGIAWDLFWAALAASVVFVAVHVLLIWRIRKRIAAAAAAPAGEVPPGPEGAGLPSRIERHSLPSRLFHWTMALAMIALLVTAFVPVMGLQFDWLTIHWIAGLVLIGAVLFHIFHSVFFQRLLAVWVGPRDVKEGVDELKHLLAGDGEPPAKSGKYPVANKLYHHAATVATLAAVVTGILMLWRIDTPIVEQNQYLLSDSTWGWVYLLHGAGGVALVLLVIAHIYFALRPEKRWQTRSMIKGWITRGEYLTHHDPARWPVEPSGGTGDDS